MIRFAPPRSAAHGRAWPSRLLSVAGGAVLLISAFEAVGAPSESSSPLLLPNDTAGPATPATPRPADALPRSREPLAGLIPWDPELDRRWWWSGAWLYPVGRPDDMGAATPGEAGYRILRGLETDAEGSTTHQGVDLGNRQSGGMVRAAAHGVVIRARASKTNGYGHHVVLAHRLDGGGFAYSVYAHLAPGSINVREGDVVPAGATLGRVGRSGRASTDHLHFEVRVGGDPFVRWERVPPVDPLTFVDDRVPAPREERSWGVAYLEWAERSALIVPGMSGDQPLERRTWWRMLLRASTLELPRVPPDLESLRLRLVDAGLLARGVEQPGPATIGWDELSRDLSRLSGLGVRLPPCPVEPDEHRSLLTTRLSLGRQATDTEDETAPTLPLTLADACLALAALSDTPDEFSGNGSN